MAGAWKKHKVWGGLGWVLGYGVPGCESALVGMGDVQEVFR